MTNTQIIAQHLEIERGKEQGHCCICGQDTEIGFKTKNFIKAARFTNYDLMNDINSDVICENCACCMKEVKLRHSSFVASHKGIIYFCKNDIENILFNISDYVEGEFVVCITRSFKKPNSFRARVNNDTKKFFIREEDDEYVFDVQKMHNVYEVINELYLYYNKDEIKTGAYNTKQIRKYLGIDKTLELDNKIKDYRNSKQFDLLLHILNSEKRNEIVKQRLQEEKNAKKSS